MKRVVTLFLIVSLVAINSCEKGNWTPKDTSPNAVYLEGKNIVSLRSSFWGGVGGGQPKTKSRFHFTLYEQAWEEIPNYPYDTNDPSATVQIFGTRYYGIEYKDFWQSVDQIVIHFPDEISGIGKELRVKITQGEYKGENPLVKDVKLVKFGDEDKNELFRIEIKITLTDGRFMHIHYIGSTKVDGYL